MLGNDTVNCHTAPQISLAIIAEGGFGGFDNQIPCLGGGDRGGTGNLIRGSVSFFGLDAVLGLGHSRFLRRRFTTPKTVQCLLGVLVHGIDIEQLLEPTHSSRGIVNPLPDLAEYLEGDDVL
ncbi:MAG: hypothetical protein O7A04_08170, partial [Acidobacteria bacterium]|nr:hypothetical protein [Acidobacteriota bacterium]